MGLEEEEPCTKWHFNTSVYTTTLTSEFDLVCGRASLRATFQSLVFFSNIVGAPVMGYVSDRLGRKVELTVVILLSTFSITIISFLESFEAILFFRFISGLFFSATTYLIALEVSEVKYRTRVGILVGLPRAVGVMGWGGIAYFIRDWRNLQMAVSFPFLLMLVYLYLMDESPRWLIVMGHHERALKVLSRAARLNKVTLPPDDTLRHFMTSAQEEAELQPTEVRMQGKSLMRLGTRTAAGIAPYIADSPSDTVPKWLPSVLLGCVSVCGGLTLLPLPETLDANLPDTIDDLDTLWINKP
ncbi:hypothetical protein Pmani_026064 [Petrolisthes manimaculis]|uniref:Major facilitator superfamily (MFS) profile domain-containing protein n=1 Tax=Petrolisthes manimaculis TaxID=1843537 RepID=A0AAE1P6Q4_9EUCA|nr:hypothetical protein Pmani_026064 [Petrolisthes manimaculis]